MAELTPIPSAQRPADPSYQPVSGYAVAAAITAGVFAVIAAVLLAQGFLSGRSAMWEELLALPILGIILAAIARSQIRNSEGTRTGLRLASAAWWVCVLGGVGFWAYQYANKLVLERESARAAERFFGKLKAGQLHEAFEDLLPPEERGRADPKDPAAYESVYAPVGFQTFKNHDLVRLVIRSGPAAEFDRVTVRDLGQEGAGFKATQVYKLTCPDGVFDVQVRMMAAESRKSRQLQWYIPSQPVPNFSIRPVKLSQYGRALGELEQEADAYAQRWMTHLSAGRVYWAHLMTLPAARGQPHESDMNAAVLLLGGPAASTPLRRESLPPDRAARASDQAPASLGTQARLGFDDLAAAGFFRADDAGTALSAEKLAKLRELWGPPRLGPASRHNPLSPGGPQPPWTTLTPDALTCVVPAELAPDSPFQYFRCRLAVVCSKPDVIAALDAARQRGASATDDASLTRRSMPDRDWRIVWLQTDAEAQTTEPAPGMGGPPRR